MNVLGLNGDEITFAKKTNNKNSMSRKTSRMFALNERHKNLRIKVRT